MERTISLRDLTHQEQEVAAGIYTYGTPDIIQELFVSEVEVNARALVHWTRQINQSTQILTIPASECKYGIDADIYVGVYFEEGDARKYGNNVIPFKLVSKGGRS